MQTIQPVDNRILFQLLVKDDSKIIIPDKIDTILGHAKILAVGPKVTNCKAGDTVMLMSEISIHPVDDKKKIGITNDGVVLAIIESEPALTA